MNYMTSLFNSLSFGVQLALIVLLFVLSGTGVLMTVVALCVFVHPIVGMLFFIAIFLIMSSYADYL